MYNPVKPYKNQILKLIKKTWDTPYLTIQQGVYPVFKKKFTYFEIDHTDGIGTKGIYHWKKRTFRNAVLDALAMNLNDLALARAVPYKLQCHLTLPKDEKKTILEIMNALVKECKKYHIAITGGETSIQNNFNGLDISLTVSGFIKKLKENRFRQGDILIGLQSNGFHSNGYTIARGILGDIYHKEFTDPTKIYLETILELSDKYDIHGMMHITGGAYTKLKDLLIKTDIIIIDHKLKPQKIFQEIYLKGVSDKEMYRTFNCGIGFILSVSEEEAKEIVAKLKDSIIIGKVTKGTGKIKIESAFSKKIVEL